MFNTYLGKGTKTRKCPLPSDTIDRIAKEPVERSEEDQAYIENVQNDVFSSFNTNYLN